MTDTKISRPARGRPRAFDVDAALDTAQALFHERGYAAVGVAALTEALGISPPSFYAAFGSKAALFDRVLARYAASALPMDRIFRPGRDVPEALADLLATVAEVYSAQPATAGCLVLETVRSPLEEECAGPARQYRLATHERVQAFIAAVRPDLADSLADYVDVVMSGLSAAAREGWDSGRLAGVARLSAETILRQWSD